LVLFSLISCLFGSGQSLVAAPPLDGRWSVAAGGATTSPMLITNTPHRKLGLLSVGCSQALVERPHWQLDYAPELLPFFAISEPHEEGIYLFRHSGEVRAVNQGPSTIYGAGASPLAFRFTLLPSARVAPYIDAGGGFLLSGKPIPYQVDDGTKFNFTFHVGGGVRLTLDPRWEVFAGYRWFHISNAYRTSINPGIDANLFEMGLRW
jgi:hypothetical protein